MIEFIAQNLAPIMFLTLIVFLLMGYPVAFSLAANGLAFFVIAVILSPYSDSITLDWPLLGTWPGRVLDVMRNDQLLAIPFFTFMGIILERSRMAEDLLDTVGQLFGSVRGGLAYAVIFVGALLAATTGVVAASVMAMGLISLPIMLRYGYDRSLATGVITASGTLAQIIPPSLVLIVLADQLGASVGDMYAGALLPGLLLVVFFCIYVLAVTILKPAAAPALPPEARTLGRGGGQVIVMLAIGLAGGFATYWLMAGHVQRGPAVWAASAGALLVYCIALADKSLGLNRINRLTQQVIFVLMPPLALIFLVLGTIFIGLATPTEGGAMGASGAILLALAKRRLTFHSLSDALDATTRLSCFVLFILIGSRVFSLTFYGVEGHKWVEHLFTNLPGGEWGFLIAVNLLVFILGCFIDFFEIAFIVIPLLAPVAKALGIDLVWFGVIIAMNLQTSFLTPPFGFALFYMRSVTPVKAYLDKVTGRTIAGVPTVQIYRGAVTFIILQLLMVGVVMLFPHLVIPEKAAVIDTKSIEIELPPPGGDVGEGGLVIPGAPDLSQPPQIE
ncbi:MAG: TRAP transporter large permease subunit [Rhizobiales bacterium]|nr:TRAP transporter large permease subunit [Hyphomicrobiales bacterium]